MMELRRSSRIKARTDAVGPRLLTAGRKRGYHIESQEEKDQRVYEEMKSYRFRARPPPESAYQGSSSTGVPKKKSRKVTKAKTPMALKRKAVSRTGVMKAKNKGTNNAMKRLKALPLPDLKKVFEVARAELKVTKPQPFSFESKYPKPAEVKEKLIKETAEQEKKQREFKAKPLYETEGFKIDHNLSKTCTKIEPFNISKPDAYQEKLMKLDQTIEKENMELQKKREFKAKYPHVIFEEPFIPEKDSRYCKIEEFNLHSDKRGEDRRKFDQELEEQRLMLEKEKAHEAIERETLNKKEITELRNKMVHRANNIGEYSKQAYDDIS